MPQKVVSPASVIGGDVARISLPGDSVRLMRKRNTSQQDAAVSQHSAHLCSNVIEHLRAQIKCIEGRLPVLDPGIGPSPSPVPKHAGVHVYGHQYAADGSADDENHRHQDAPDTPSSVPLYPKPFKASDVEAEQEQSVLPQAGVPADRFVDEDGGIFPCSPQPPALPSSFSATDYSFSINNAVFATAARSATSHPIEGGSHLTQQPWTLGRQGVGNASGQVVREFDCSDGSFDITQLPLNVSGVHEIKPACAEPDGLSGSREAPKREDWAASLSAARFFMLSLMVRRLAASPAALDKQTAEKPILWCIPRSASLEHGAPYMQGLNHFGLQPGRVLFVATASEQDTLWTLEEGLKSESVSLVVSFIDDVSLTPARRLALATKKHNTPCLLLTHPRTPPISATASRWRIAARSSAPHSLTRSGSRQHIGPILRLPGARRFSVTLERYRAAPRYVTGQEIMLEWSDEALCSRLVPSLSNRSHAPREPIIAGSRRTVRSC